MDNSKKSVHRAGPLGLLLERNMVKSIDLDENEEQAKKDINKAEANVTAYKTQTGIIFTKDELITVNTAECEPWEYANRQQIEVGQIDELIRSIKENGQLQPALIRNHPKPHGIIKYEVIFGYRRLLSCEELNIPLLAILKQNLEIYDALAMQEEENKNREDISDYSNAMHYKRLLTAKIFESEKDLACKFRMSRSSLNDLMAFTRIPHEILNKIPTLKTLSVSMALKIDSLLKTLPQGEKCMISLAPDIGTIITSPAKLEQAANLSLNKKKVSKKDFITAKVVHSKAGDKLFTFKSTSNGIPAISFNRKLSHIINFDEICEILKEHIEKTYV